MRFRAPSACGPWLLALLAVGCGGGGSTDGAAGAGGGSQGGGGGGQGGGAAGTGGGTGGAGGGSGAGGGGGGSIDGPPADSGGESGGEAGGSMRVPIDDLATGTYLGFQGGLYPGGANTLPVDHAAAGIARAKALAPLDTSGAPAPGGKIVLLSIGMSNTTQEWCSGSSDPPCDAWTLTGRAAADAAVEKTRLAIVNGAAGSQTALLWDSPTDANYDRVRDKRLVPAGLSEKQVQAIWLKVANPGPTKALPAAMSDAYALEKSMGDIARAAKTRYSNLSLVFASSRIYAGYATTMLNPEPYAYESGFAVKWLVEAQVVQMKGGGPDKIAGDLDYAKGTAPWIAWGPYLWADGTKPRSDGLVWEKADFTPSDGTHPSMSGRSKVGMLLLDFFKTSPETRCWFLASGTCP